LENMQKLSLTMTSLIQDGHGAVHPPSFTHFPGVESHFGFFRENNGANFIGYTPIITKQDRDEWISYSQQEAEWTNAEPHDFSHGFGSFSHEESSHHSGGNVLGQYYDGDDDELGEGHDDEQDGHRHLQQVNTTTDDHQDDDDHDDVQDDGNVELTGGVSVLPYIWKYTTYEDDGTEIPLNDLDCDWHARYDHSNLVHMVDMDAPANPLWHYSPVPKQSGINAVNFNVRSDRNFKEAFELVEEEHRPTFHYICPSAQWFKVRTQSIQ
jgi:hypothetical protein